MPDPVRPTKRALEDLELGFPALIQPLHRIDHPLVEHAQRVPQEREAGGAERIRELDDRIWFKVKTSNYRGAAGEVNTAADPSYADLASSGWWLVAAGHRQADTSGKDFYARIADECARAGRGTGHVSTDHLLPAQLDYERWIAEEAALAVVAIKRVVREAIARSAQTGGMRVAETRHHRIGALVVSREGETYLAVMAEGFVDPRMLAIVLDAVPGVDPGDWLPEPAAVLEIDPGPGQLVFSTMLPGLALASILEEVDGHYL